jgi:hypothetical protein
VTVTSGLAVWKPAIQLSCAAPTADEPAPTRVPVRADAASSGASPSFAAQALRTRAPMTAMAATLPARLMFTVVPF